MDKGDRLSAKMTSRFADGDKVVVNMNQRTDETEVKVGVGVLGNEERQNQVFAAIKKRVESP